jgi:hypothetical protein
MTISSRESATEKGRRYVGEGRLMLDIVSADAIRGSCRGSGTVHRVTWTPEDSWACSCEAKTRCSHLVAVQLVTATGRGAT